MHPSLIPPRQVMIGDAAAFVGTTPRAIRHYHGIGLLPEPERGADGRRRYGYEQMIRLLWIRRMAEAGIALDDIRDAFADAALADGARAVLERLERSLAAQEEELRRQRAAVRSMRGSGSRAGLLSDLVIRRLESVPEGALRQADLDTLLVTERILGPLGAAVQAGRFLALATRPGLREESDRVEAAEEALDDAVAVDDPRVAQVAAERHAFEQVLQAVIAASGQDQDDEALFDEWDAAHPDGVEGGREMSAVEAVGRMPYDFSPARLRCMELVAELESRLHESTPPA
ncbi:MerR family transcriptional regulator [Rathayibacter sp. Leaf248]|uniref:MerR family transcriptional regulator n=1 Tax=Rathayibacter sp. Leaf248 TaxID=2876555 RepID=UPI001E576C15|nr:MerR family transcriptional regulator [Rathayibacter sp. Leaf248]